MEAGSPPRPVRVYPWTLVEKKSRRKPYWLRIRNEAIEQAHIKRMTEQHLLEKAWAESKER